MITQVVDILNGITQKIINIEIELSAYESKDEETEYDILEGKRIRHQFIWKKMSPKSPTCRIHYERFNKVTEQIEIHKAFSETPVHIRLRFEKYLDGFRDSMIEYLKYED